MANIVVLIFPLDSQVSPYSKKTIELLISSCSKPFINIFNYKVLLLELNFVGNRLYTLITKFTFAGKSIPIVFLALHIVASFLPSKNESSYNHLDSVSCYCLLAHRLGSIAHLFNHKTTLLTFHYICFAVAPRPVSVHACNLIFMARMKKHLCCFGSIYLLIEGA